MKRTSREARAETGREDEARDEFAAAARLAGNDRERALLLQKARS